MAKNSGKKDGKPQPEEEAKRRKGKRSGINDEGFKFTTNLKPGEYLDPEPLIRIIAPDIYKSILAEIEEELQLNGEKSETTGELNHIRGSEK